MLLAGVGKSHVDRPCRWQLQFAEVATSHVGQPYLIADQACHVDNGKHTSEHTSSAKSPDWVVNRCYSRSTSWMEFSESNWQMVLTDPHERLAARKHVFNANGAVNPAVVVSTTFAVRHPGLPRSQGDKELAPNHDTDGWHYGRTFNPTVGALGSALAALEGTEAAHPVASGMAAISATLLSLCNGGDHIVASNAVYGGTFALLKYFLPAKCGIKVSFVPIQDLEAVASAITTDTKVLYAETLSNPTLRVADLPALAKLAHGVGATFVVDNTFAPCVVSPAQWGADVVIHSLTKYINGASDIIAGVVCGSREFIDSLASESHGTLMSLGPTMDPKTANDILLRLPHLSLRMKEHSSRALFLATKLQEKGLKVVYPGLQEHPQHDLLQQLGNAQYGAGGIFTLDTGSLETSLTLMESLQNEQGFGLMAVSLGYFDTLMSPSGTATSKELSAEDKQAAGISSGLIRFSVGITGSVQQRWAQLQAGLAAAGLCTDEH